MDGCQFEKKSFPVFMGLSDKGRINFDKINWKENSGKEESEVDKPKRIAHKMGCNSRKMQNEIFCDCGAKQHNDLCEEWEKWIRNEIEEIIREIEKEIESNLQYPNVGKRGCVRRLKKFLAQIQE